MASPEKLIEVWRRIIVGDTKSWVLFEHGTCVILVDAAGDLESRAIEILREYGPVHAGGPPGDFGTITLDPPPGWVVTGHHPDVLTYVDPDDVSERPTDLGIGLTGRARRNQDGHELKVIHVEVGLPRTA